MEKEDRIMEKLQTKYNLLHIAYWMNALFLYGFIAVLLQYKGLTNTQIGIATGGASVVTIVLSPLISQKCAQIRNYSLQQILIVFYVITCILFLTIGFAPVSSVFIIGLYMILYSINISTVPLVSTIAMNYIEDGHPVNFGLSRGLGSVSYAITALAAGQLTAILPPTILCILFVASALLVAAILKMLPATYSKAGKKTDREKSNIVSTMLKYRQFTGLLTGFGLAFAGSACLGTYLINIVKNLGGNTSMLGLATFFMAASELPFMTIAPRLMRRFKTKNLLVFAAVMYVVRNGMACFAFNIPMLLAGLACQGISYGLFTPIITYYVAENLEPKDQIMGQTMIGVMTSGAGAALGNMTGGFLQDTFGMSVMLAFVIGVTLAGVLIVTLINGRRQPAEQPELATTVE